METHLILIVAALFASTSGNKFNFEYVTWGSTIKLMNTGSTVRLHSHDVMYGSGSGQQSVTGVDSPDDSNSYWIVRGIVGQDIKRGEPVRCGQLLRLTHMTSGRNLHSHHYPSPLSNNLEVSAFGDNGIGDDGDNWMLECSSDEWKRSEKVRLRHAVTGYYLHVTGDAFGRPIHGQMEVSGYPSQSELNQWAAAEGVYIKPSLLNTAGHDEL